MNKQVILELRTGFFVFFLIVFLHASNLCVAAIDNKPFETKKTINVYLNDTDGNFTTISNEVVIGSCKYEPEYIKFRDQLYNGRVVSFAEKNLAYFGIESGLPPIECIDGMDENGKMIGGCTEQPNEKIFIQLPYFPNGKYADIYDPSGKKILTIDLSSKATCNENDRCDRPVEDGENCPQDCTKNEPKIDPTVMQKAETESQKQAVAENGGGKISLSSLGWWPIVVGLLLLLGGGGIGYYVYRKNRRYQG